MSFGSHLKKWRQARHLSQLELAAEAAVSTRHISFVETGRANPSREMVMRLCARMEVPLRERNAMLVAAGYAPMYRETALHDAALAPARAAVALILQSHEPWPAIAVDRHWNMLLHNATVPLLLQGVAAELLEPPVNVLRLTLHPKGLAANILNLPQLRWHLLERLQSQVQHSGDPALRALHAELAAYPAPPHSTDAPSEHLAGEMEGIVLPMRYRSPVGVLNLLSTITVFGTPVDITLHELALETFFPADDFTRDALTALVQSAPLAPSQPVAG